jgi:uncharacterized membrane protein HdeD (DUF308 family)
MNCPRDAQTMSRKNAPHAALALVSYLFLIVGLAALSTMISRSLHGALHLNFGILGIGIFFGLRRSSPAWRTCALWFNAYGMAAAAFGIFLCLNAPAHGPLGAGTWILVPLILLLLVAVWQHKVLTHPAVRRLFYTTARRETAAEMEAAGTAEAEPS